MGFRTVALSHSDAKRELARQLGAVAYLDSSKQDVAQELVKMGGAKVIVCTAPHPEIMEGLIPGLTVGGQLLVLALPNKKGTFDLCEYQFTFPPVHSKTDKHILSHPRHEASFYPWMALRSRQGQRGMRCLREADGREVHDREIPARQSPGSFRPSRSC